MKSKMKVGMFLLVILLALILSGHAQAVLIQDNYVGWNYIVLAGSGGEYIQRDGQDVLHKAGGTAILKDTGSVDPANAGMNNGYILYGIEMASLGTISGSEIGLKWGATCANYVIEGAASVPEPTTMFLFGTGLLAFAGLGRKRLLKK